MSEGLTFSADRECIQDQADSTMPGPCVSLQRTAQYVTVAQPGLAHSEVVRGAHF